MRQPLASIFHAGTVTVFERSELHSFSTFGGPLEHEVVGAELSRPLHQIIHLNHNNLKAIAPPCYVFDLPLVHGMAYSGCALTYRFEFDRITIESLSPAQPTNGWPYRDYPALFPFYPITEVEVTRQTWSEFSERAPNLPEDQPAELVALVPPPVGLGFTLWGAHGDAEGVTLVFECDLNAKRVSAYSVFS